MFEFDYSKFLFIPLNDYLLKKINELIDSDEDVQATLYINDYFDNELHIAEVLLDHSIGDSNWSSDFITDYTIDDKDVLEQHKKELDHDIDELNRQLKDYGVTTLVFE